MSSSTSNSKKGLKPIVYVVALAASTIVWMIAIVGGVWLYGRGSLPPVPLTASASFNEKTDFLRRRGGIQADVLALGSSMALNNLHSEELVAALPKAMTYLNAASWGMKTKHVRRFLDFLVERSSPKLVVLSIGPVDFYTDEREVANFDAAELDSFLNNRSLWWLSLRHFDLTYYLKNARVLSDWKSRRDIYPSLQFDEWGAAPLTVPPANVDRGRWETVFNPAILDEAQFGDLEAMAALLARKNIRLLVVQAPLRAASVPPSRRPDLERFWARVNGIAVKYGHRFYNAHDDMRFDDSKFADWCHLNGSATSIFSAAVARRLYF